MPLTSPQPAPPTIPLQRSPSTRHGQSVTTATNPPVSAVTVAMAPDGPGSTRAAVDAARQLSQRALTLLERVAPAMVRLSLGLVFVWFGALKAAGDSPVLALVSATLPWAEPQLLMPVLGVVEILLGVGLLLGRAQRLLLLLLAAHLSGTFLTFVVAPELIFQHGSPLLLTADGEFVLKNLVLISAALLLVARAHPTRRVPMTWHAHAAGPGVHQKPLQVPSGPSR